MSIYNKPLIMVLMDLYELHNVPQGVQRTMDSVYSWVIANDGIRTARLTPPQNVAANISTLIEIHEKRCSKSNEKEPA